MRCGVYHPADARNRAAGRPQTNRAQASSWRPPTHPFSPSERERWAGARLAGPLNAQNLPPRRQTRGTRRRVLWPSAVAPDQPCFVTPAGMPRHRTWQPLPFRGWGGEGRGAWTAGSHVRPGHRCGHWTAVHRRASCWRAPSQGLDKKERRANARHPLPPSKNNAHGPPREGSGGGGPPVEPGHATTSWATAGRTRAVGSARRPTSRIPRVTADPSTLLPPPALGLRLLTARTARQEHLPAAVQSTQRTGWGSGDDRRPPAARQGRHSARPPRLRCAGGRADGQGSCWVPHSSPPPPSTFRRAADADRLPGERIWAGGHQAPVQLGPQARGGELPATPPPPPHSSPCSSESPSPRADPKSRRGTRLVGFAPLRGSCPPAPPPSQTPHGRWSHPRAPCVRRGVGGPPKGLVGGPIRVRRLRLCALPSTAHAGWVEGLHLLPVALSIPPQVCFRAGVGRPLVWAAGRVGWGRRHSRPCVLFRERTRALLYIRATRRRRRRRAPPRGAAHAALSVQPSTTLPSTARR